ncbi:protein-S-isoprenylcysteine O-methyltransferase, putative [Plasmodium ovale]|uniref:Protein-S-isoprenylcysteine O-methyltransferase n=1 Tax=Plasmodium ovale TaxID=36330 RepID=A0A1D3UAQ0_PLAOA|nr:protein-S-isoprenylcysteine O-methyltransferase, putative [Plasmodium ovale]
MNVGIYIVISLLLYVSLLNYKMVIYLLNQNIFAIAEKRNIYNFFEYYLHTFLEYGFVTLYILVSFLPSKNVYTKRSQVNYIFAKILLIYFLFFLFHFLFNIRNNFPLNLFYLVITSFHLSEFFLSFTHNKNNYNYYNFLVNPNYGYAYFFILTLVEYYAKIFLFVVLHTYERYINKGVLYKLLIVNNFFLNSYQDSYGICTYSYTNQTQINNLSIFSAHDLYGQKIVKSPAKVKCKKYILDAFLSKRKLLKESAFLYPLPRPVSEGKNSYNNTQTYSDNNDNELFKLKTQQREEGHTANVHVGEAITLSPTQGRCILPDIGEILSHGKYTKVYNLNNSLFMKTIVKYGKIFDKYEIPRCYENVYNYYLFAVLSFLLLSLIGLFLRILGLIHCSRNFSFYVLSSDKLINKYVKRKHNLVKWGLYKYMRHPCYTGWFYYALFLQLLLCNVVCFFLCFVISWTYFYRTIKAEEKCLLECYEEEYRTYKAQTPHIYIPFMKNI